MTRLLHSFIIHEHFRFYHKLKDEGYDKNGKRSWIGEAKKNRSRKELTLGF